MNALVAGGQLIAAALVGPRGGGCSWFDGLDQLDQEQQEDVYPDRRVVGGVIGDSESVPRLRDPTAEYEEADSYVIALVKLRGGTVLTQETSAAEKNRPHRTHFIPDGCRESGIPCIRLLDLMRKEGWTF